MNILKTKVIGMRGGKKLPKVLFPLSDWHVIPSKKEAVQLNAKSSELKNEKVTSKVKRIRVNKPLKKALFPNKARLNISSI